MILLDTGYLIALMDNRDELHERAVSWSSAITESVLVTEYVLVETVNLLSRPEDRPKAQALVEQCRQNPGIEVVGASAALFEAGLALHAARSDKLWSLTDCISFAVMTDRGISRALAFDRHFEQAGFEALLRRDP